MWKHLPLTLPLVLAGWPATAEDAPPPRPAGVWGPAVMPQPFDAGPFRTVRVPDWVEDTVGCGYTLSGMDAAARQRAAAHGVTLSELGFVDPFYPYYDSRLLKRRSPHVPPGRLDQDIAEFKRLASASWPSTRRRSRVRCTRPTRTGGGSPPTPPTSRRST